MDPESFSAIEKIVGGVLGVRLIGPTVDYLGQGIKNWTERRHHNLQSIVNRAVRISGDRILEEGRVPPRVLKHVLDEGSFAEDVLMQEYYGGMLASSRSSIPRDDRGAIIAQMIAQMSTYMIRGHYIIYSVIRQIHIGSEIPIGVGKEDELGVFIPAECLREAMAFTGGK